MKIRILTLIIMAFMANPAYSYIEAWFDTPIQRIIVHDDGTDSYSGSIHVVMTTPLIAKPDCASLSDRFIIDLSRGAGNAQYSAVLAARMSGKNISVQLNNTCIGGTAVVRNVVIGN